MRTWCRLLINNTATTSDDKAAYSYWFGTYPYDAALHPKDVFAPIKAIVCQGEKGKEDGYQHWQFFVQLEKKVRFSTLRNALLDKKVKLPIWLRGIKGNNKVEILKCIKYCQKEDTRIEGTTFLLNMDGDVAACKRGQGRREDLEAARTALIDSRGAFDILSMDANLLSVFAKYPRFFSAVASRAMGGTPRPPMTLVCFWGATGVGKTARAHLLAAEAGYKPHEIYVKDSANVWWCGYDAAVHKVVIVEEVRVMPKEVCSMFLEETNPGFVKNEQVKGGSVIVRAELWIFTSPTHPENWIWAQNQDDKSQQFVRRFGPNIYEFKKAFVHPVALEAAPALHASAIAKICKE